MNRIETRLKKIEGLRKQIAQEEEIKRKYAENDKLYSLLSQLYGLEKEVSLLQYLDGLDEDRDPGTIPVLGNTQAAVFLASRDFLKEIPFDGPILVDRGRDGDVFMGFAPGRKGHGPITVECQTRYLYNTILAWTSQAACDEVLTPRLSTWDLPETSDRKRERFRIRLLDLPPEVDLPPNASRIALARENMTNALFRKGYLSDGFIRFSTEGVVGFIESYPWWDRVPG